MIGCRLCLAGKSERSLDCPTLKKATNVHSIRQNPQCEGVFRERSIFNGKTSGKRATSETAGITTGAEFEVYQNQNSSHLLGTVVVRELNAFSTTLYAKESRISLEQDVVALESRTRTEKQVRIHVADGNHLKKIDPNRRIPSPLVGRDRGAEFAITFENGKVVFNFYGADVMKSGLNRLENIFDPTLDAVSYLEKATHLTLEGHTDLLSWLNNLGNSFLPFLDGGGDPAEVLDATSSNNAGDSFHHCSKHTGKLVDLFDEGNADILCLLNNFGNSFLPFLDGGGDPAEILYGASPNNVGNSFLHCLERTGELVEVLDECHVRQCHADILCLQLLNNFGNPFLPCLERGGDLAEISDATSPNIVGKSFLHCFERAGDLVDVSDERHADILSRLNNFGNPFLRRFEYEGKFANISGAITPVIRAVAHSYHRVASYRHRSRTLQTGQHGLAGKVEVDVTELELESAECDELNPVDVYFYCPLAASASGDRNDFELQTGKDYGWMIINNCEAPLYPALYFDCSISEYHQTSENSSFKLL